MFSCHIELKLATLQSRKNAECPVKIIFKEEEISLKRDGRRSLVFEVIRCVENCVGCNSMAWYLSSLILLRNDNV